MFHGWYIAACIVSPCVSVKPSAKQIIQVQCECLGLVTEKDTEAQGGPARSGLHARMRDAAEASRAGKDLRISYPCVMLNVMVAQHCTNAQYADLVDAASRTYATSSRRCRSSSRSMGRTACAFRRLQSAIARWNL